MVNIKKHLIRDIILISVISGIAAPLTIHMLFMPDIPISIFEFSVSLASNFILGFFIYYIIISGNLKEYFSNVVSTLKNVKRSLEGAKGYHLEDLKKMKIDAEKDDFIYEVTEELNRLIEELYYNELLDGYQREAGKILATLGSPENLAKSFYKFLLENFGIIAMCIYMKKSEKSSPEKLISINFKNCEVSDFIETTFKLQDLKILKTTELDVELPGPVKVHEILIMPIKSMDSKAVLLLAKASKFKGLELRFLRKIKDLLSLSLANAVNYQRLQEESYVDPLTKLYNRRFGIARFQELISLTSREKSPLIVSMLDIDDFKKINDTYGHLAGDFVLKELAEIVKNHIRDIDLVLRYGGEEILLVLFNTDRENGIKVLDRIRKSIEEHKFIFEDKKIPVTVSIGCLHIPPEKFNIFSKERYNTYIEKADGALYTAKKTGKNRVVCNESNF